MQSSCGVGLGLTWPGCEYALMSARGQPVQAHLPPTHIHTSTHMHSCAYTRARSYPYVTHSHTVMYTCAHMQTQNHTVTHMRTRTESHSQARAHVQSYTHTDMQVIGEKSFLRAPLLILPFPSFCSLLALPPLPSLVTASNFISRDTSPGFVVWSRQAVVKRIPS